MVESSALLKRRTPKGYRGFESLPHRHVPDLVNRRLTEVRVFSRTGDSNSVRPAGHEAREFGSSGSPNRDGDWGQSPLPRQRAALDNPSLTEPSKFEFRNSKLETDSNRQIQKTPLPCRVPRPSLRYFRISGFDIRISATGGYPSLTAPLFFLLILWLRPSTHQLVLRPKESGTYPRSN